MQSGYKIHVLMENILGLSNTNLNICRIQNKNPHSNTETLLLTVRCASGSLISDIRDVMMMLNLNAFVVLSS